MGLPKQQKKLKPNGKLIIITFHSLEDKIVKFFSRIFLKISQFPLDTTHLMKSSFIFLMTIKIELLDQMIMKF